MKDIDKSFIISTLLYEIFKSIYAANLYHPIFEIYQTRFDHLYRVQFLQIHHEKLFVHRAKYVQKKKK
jgi:hypothetical protein